MKKITPERLKNIALYYLERYEASTSKLRLVLERRLLKARSEQEIPPEVPRWIEEVIQQMCRLGYVNDQRFAENMVYRLTHQGRSASYMRTKLKLAGIKEDTIMEVLSDHDELNQARLMVQKKHMGKDFPKDLARLARSGFSYEIARQALEEVSKK